MFFVCFLSLSLLLSFSLSLTLSLTLSNISSHPLPIPLSLLLSFSLPDSLSFSNSVSHSLQCIIPSPLSNHKSERVIVTTTPKRTPRWRRTLSMYPKICVDSTTDSRYQSFIASAFMDAVSCCTCIYMEIMTSKFIIII